MAPNLDTHDWVRIEPKSPYCTCRVCHVSGKTIGTAWPPVRDPKYINPTYRTCEGARKMMVVDDLKRRGVTVDPEELS